MSKAQLKKHLKTLEKDEIIEISPCGRGFPDAMQEIYEEALYN